MARHSLDAGHLARVSCVRRVEHRPGPAASRGLRCRKKFRLSEKKWRIETSSFARLSDSRQLPRYGPKDASEKAGLSWLDVRSDQLWRMQEGEHSMRSNLKTIGVSLAAVTGIA